MFESVCIHPHAFACVWAGLKVVKMIYGVVAGSPTLTLRFNDEAYGIHRFHKGCVVTLTGVTRLGTTARNLCFTAAVQYCP